MDNLIAEKFPYSRKELECLATLERMPYEEIDLSDIPEITHEEWVTRFKPSRLRKKNTTVAS